MKQYDLGDWILEFDHEDEYRIIKDENSAVVIDKEREAVVLISLNIVDKESMHVKISTVHAKASANEDKHK